MSRLGEVPETLALKVVDAWPPHQGPYVLRFTSWYTGETVWHWDWDGESDTAVAWIEEVADIVGALDRPQSRDGTPSPRLGYCCPDAIAADRRVGRSESGAGAGIHRTSPRQ
jgi:hypothetical protein